MLSRFAFCWMYWAIEMGVELVFVFATFVFASLFLLLLLVILFLLKVCVEKMSKNGEGLPSADMTTNFSRTLSVCSRDLREQFRAGKDLVVC